MKKKNYSVCAFALMALVTSVSVNAQSMFRTKSQQKMATVIPQSAILQSAPRFGASKQQAKPHFVAANQLSRVSAKELEAKSNEKVVATSFTHTVGSTQSTEGKAKYDQQGRVVNITSDDNISVNITYADNVNGKWTTKTMSTMNLSTQQETERTKTERTFDVQGRILSIDDFTYDVKGEKWQPTHSYAYDYEHIGMDEDAISNNEAVITKDISFKERENGLTFRDGYEYIWYTPSQSYVKSSFSIDHNTEYQLNGNILKWSEEYADANTGDIYSVQYYKEEVHIDKPQTDFYTLIQSKSDDNNVWIPISKIEISNNYNAPYDPDETQKRVMSTYYYDEYTQEFYFDEKEVIECVSHPSLQLVKASYFNDQSDIASPTFTFYIQVNEQGQAKGNLGGPYLCLSDNGDYTIIESAEPDLNLTYYSAKGEIIRQVKIIETTSTSHQAPYIVVELKNGEWSPIKNETLKTGDSGFLVYIVKTNEKGYPTEISIPNWLNSIKITYNDTGYIINTFTSDKYFDQTYLESQETCTLLADGSHEIITTGYDRDGTITGHKRHIYKNGIDFAFGWDEDNNDWSSVFSAKVAPIITQDSDGTKITIERKYEHGEIVNAQKIIEKPYNISAISMKIPTNPLPEVVPDKIFTQIHRPEASKGVNTELYYWNADTEQWELQTSDYDDVNGMDILEGVGEHTYFVTEGGLKYCYVIKDNGLLTDYIVDNHSYIFEYDEEGRLTKIADQSEGDEETYETYVIYYGKIMVSDGISLPITASRHLHVNDRAISADESKNLQLYSLDGKLVGKSQTGSVTAPTAGVYVVVADGVKTKINVR